MQGSSPTKGLGDPEKARTPGPLHLLFPLPAISSFRYLQGSVAHFFQVNAQRHLFREGYSDFPLHHNRLNHGAVTDPKVEWLLT